MKKSPFKGEKKGVKNKEEVKPVRPITPADRKLFASHARRVGTSRLTWDKIHAHLNSTTTGKKTAIADILAGMLHLPASYLNKVKYAHKQLKLFFKNEMDQLHPPTEEEKKFPVNDIDLYCRTWMDWHTKKVVSYKSFTDLITMVNTYFPTDYTTEYLITELKEMMEAEAEGKELTTFSTFKPRKKIGEKDEPEENESNK